MMKNFPDVELYFGEASLSSGAFAKEVEIGKSQPGRMHVRFFVTEDAAGGTSVVFKLQGKEEGGSFTDIASSVAIPSAQLKAGTEVVVEIPESFKGVALKAVATPSGSFSAGKAEAWIDTYLGL